jgi:hypothetical protein
MAELGVLPMRGKESVSTAKGADVSHLFWVFHALPNLLNLEPERVRTQSLEALHPRNLVVALRDLRQPPLLPLVLLPLARVNLLLCI